MKATTQLFFSMLSRRIASEQIRVSCCILLMLASTTPTVGQDTSYSQDADLSYLDDGGGTSWSNARATRWHDQTRSPRADNNEHPPFGFQPKHERIISQQRSAELQAERHHVTMERQLRLMTHEVPELLEEPVDQPSSALYDSSEFLDDAIADDCYYDGGCENDSCCECSAAAYCGDYCGEEVNFNDGYCGGGHKGWTNYRSGNGISFLSHLFQNTTLFAGTHGFTGPSNLSTNGSLGFHQGLNIGAPLPILGKQGVGIQAGFRTTQSNLSGAAITNRQRNQSFFTTGIFWRSDSGLQGGAVFDLLRDRWHGAVDVSQARGEISWKQKHQSEFGYWFAAGDKLDSSLFPNQTESVTESWEATELHAFFYRHRFNRLKGGLGRFYAGFTGGRDGLIGADTRIPFTNRWSLDSYFTYLIPNEPTGNGGLENEAWNVGLSLVLHLGGKACRDCGNYFEPLFGVADNGNFIVDRIPTAVEPIPTIVEPIPTVVEETPTEIADSE